MPPKDLPKTPSEAYADALRDAELEYRNAQNAMQAGDRSDDAKARYAKALAHYDSLQAMFPFVSAGAGDVKA